MKNKRKIRPFAGRLTRIIMLTQFIVMGFASILAYMFIHNLMKNEEFELYKNFLGATRADVERVLTDVHVGMVNHVYEIESSLGQPDKLSAVTKRIVEQNPLIHSCAINFVDNYYPQKGHSFCPNAIRGENEEIKERASDDVRNDYLQTEWFQAAIKREQSDVPTDSAGHEQSQPMVTEVLKAENSYWSKPYIDAVDSISLVAYLMPIRDKGGQTVAILQANMSLDWLRLKLVSGTDLFRFMNEGSEIDIKNVSMEDTGLKKNTWEYRKWRIATLYFIIDKDGTFVAHPNKNRVIKDNYFTCAAGTPDSIDDSVGRRMTAGEMGIYSDEQGDYSSFSFFDISFFSVYMLYEPIAHTDWSIGLAVPSIMIDVFAFGTGLFLLLHILLALLVVQIIGWIAIRRTTKPLKQLADSAKEVAKGKFNTPLPQIKHYDEIHLLRDSFEDMQQSLTKYIDELKMTSASKAAIEKELKVAHDIQMSMLPKTFPPYPERDDIDIYGELTPAKDVGGDLFDFHIRDGQLFFCIGDVSGKGVPASLVMAVTRSLFRNISAHTSEPDNIAATLNHALSEGNDKNMFVTFFVGVLHLGTGVLRYSNAGHDAPLLISSDVEVLACDPNLPLGVMPEWNFTVQQLDMKAGTTIFLYTDGLNEAEDSLHNQFGIQHMIETAKSQLNEEDIQSMEIVKKMSEAVHSFVGEAEQSDDLTMLAIKYNGAKN